MVVRHDRVDPTSDAVDRIAKDFCIEQILSDVELDVSGVSPLAQVQNFVLRFVPAFLKEHEHLIPGCTVNSQAPMEATTANRQPTALA